jgi:hypothetical protein
LLHQGAQQTLSQVLLAMDGHGSVFEPFTMIWWLPLILSSRQPFFLSNATSSVPVIDYYTAYILHGQWSPLNASPAEQQFIRPIPDTYLR